LRAALKQTAASCSSDFRVIYDELVNQPEHASAATRLPYISAVECMKFVRHKKLPRNIFTAEEVVNFFETNRHLECAQDFHGSCDLFLRGNNTLADPIHSLLLVYILINLMFS
jgi:hypothetical protein